MPPHSPGTAPRRRRTTTEVRGLLLGAAATVFAERGYDGATTRAVAERAGVSEQVLFNQFGSKDGLWEATVLAPFAAFAEQHIAGWNEVPIGELDPHAMLTSYVVDLYRFVRQHEQLFRALGEQRFGGPVERILERLDTVATRMAELHGFAFDPAIGVRIVFSATTSIALHQGVLLPAHDDATVVAELADGLVAGLLRR